MEKQCLLDLTPKNDSECRAALFPVSGAVREFASPQIPSIPLEVLLKRLGSLGISLEVLAKIEEEIKADPDQGTDITLSATPQQLVQLGFLGNEVEAFFKRVL